MSGPILPGGTESLAAKLALNPHCLVELKSNGFVRLKGRQVEGCSFYRCVFDALAQAGGVPDTVRAFELRDDVQFAAYVAAVREAYPTAA